MLGNGLHKKNNKITAALADKIIGLLLIVWLSVLLTACSSVADDVPVTEAWRQPIACPHVYIVQSGDTLYSIAWNYGLDYRQVAVANKIAAPYAIQAGQKLYLKGAKRGKALAAIPPQPAVSVTKASAKPATVTAPVASTVAPATTEPTTEVTEPVCACAATKTLPVKKTTVSGITWAWPARGRLLGCYSATSLNKGIDITADCGSPITAAAAGKVVYAGNGLRGYGELIIIKHSDEFLSAYAHNQKLLVQEGQSVRIGQVIALMGNSEAKCVMVHFEIRKAGKPVNPCTYLPK